MWGGDPALKEPINDARSLGDELKRAGFDVETRENLSKDEMQRAINGFYAKLKRGMTGLVFFSGYGIQANRQSYLIPVDVDIWNESEVQPKGVSLDNILAEMNKRGANVKIAIVDAARRNPFERRFRKAGAEGLPPVSAPLGTLVLYSATAGTPGGLVKDSSAERSLFVGELVKEIRGQGVSAEEVFNRTRMGVSRASSNEQNPWISSSLSQEFSFPSCGRGAQPRVANTTTGTNTNTNTTHYEHRHQYEHQHRRKHDGEQHHQHLRHAVDAAAAGRLRRRQRGAAEAVRNAPERRAQEPRREGAAQRPRCSRVLSSWPVLCPLQPVQSRDFRFR